jgi:hypothetical protein
MQRGRARQGFLLEKYYQLLAIFGEAAGKKSWWRFFCNNLRQAAPGAV